MTKSIIVLSLALTTALSVQAATYHGPDKAYLKQLAPHGITEANWDNAEYGSMMYIDSHKMSDHAKIYKGGKGRTFEKSDKSLDLNKIIVSDLNGAALPLNDLLRDRLFNRSMVVLQDGKLVHEHYWSGTDKDTLQLTWSAGKSMTSSLMAIAVQDGFLKMTDPVEKYVPEAKGTVFGAYPIQYVSDMRSGFALIDTVKSQYGDDWDASMENAISWHGDVESKWIGIKDYTPHLTKLSYKQGKKFEYHSYNTELLGLITSRAVGKRWADYFEEKIWKTGQFNSDTTIMVDREKTAITSGALTMTARDFATMGDIWAHDGKNQSGEQIIPKAFLDNILAGNAEVRAAWTRGKEAGLADGWYLDQFRVLNLGGERWLVAVGVHGQIIAVNQESKTVIAMFGNYNVGHSYRMSVNYFHTAIPAIKAAIK